MDGHDCSIQTLQEIADLFMELSAQQNADKSVLFSLSNFLSILSPHVSLVIGAVHQTDQKEDDGQRACNGLNVRDCCCSYRSCLIYACKRLQCYASQCVAHKSWFSQ